VDRYILVLSLACVGSILQIIGVSWDVTSHLIRTPESFFTPSHTLLYSGVGLLLAAAIMGAKLILTRKIDNMNPIITSFKLLIIGSSLAIVAGPSDYAWHKAFGIDGLLSPTHFVLATGVIINSLAVIIGLKRMLMQVQSTFQISMIKFLAIPAFAAWWLTMIWYVYLFVLPLSNGSHFDFNLNPVTESIIAVTLLPIINAVGLLIAVRTLNMKWSATTIILLVVLINAFTNIIPSSHLMPFLPMYIVLVVIGFLYDCIIRNARSHSTGYHREKPFIISSALVGSVFYILGYPLLPITFAEPLGFTFISMSELHDNFMVTLPGILLFTVPFGALLGSISANFYFHITKTLRVKDHAEKTLNSRSSGEPI
jgi:hypothetical protein